MRGCCFGCADSRFAEPRISLWEGFNFVSAKPPLRRAESRFGKPRAFPKGNDFILFACTKRTKSTPEVCEPLDSRGRFKALSKKILAEFSNGTSRNRLFAQNGGEKALNRCDARALQRKDLERTTKEEPYSLQTVG